MWGKNTSYEEKNTHFPRRQRGIIMSGLGKLFVIESRLICQGSETTKIMLGSSIRQAGLATLWGGYCG